LARRAGLAPVGAYALKTLRPSGQAEQALAKDAVYTFSDSSGTSTSVAADQSQNGGQWQYLGGEEFPQLRGHNT